jgi:hypothetical protein
MVWFCLVLVSGILLFLGYRSCCVFGSYFLTVELSLVYRDFLVLGVSVTIFCSVDD